MKDSTGSTTSTYDSLDRRSSVTNPANKTITYAYNAVGNRAAMTAPDGGRFTCSYNAASRLSLNPDLYAVAEPEVLRT